jgi:hypothetical protein
LPDIIRIQTRNNLFFNKKTIEEVRDRGLLFSSVGVLFCGQSTRNKVRAAPLWGVRTRNRLMHDGESLTFSDAILRHGGEASFVTNRFTVLTAAERGNIIAFLRSL